MNHLRQSVDPDKIVVVASSDDNYGVPLHVMFVSLLKNTANPERFELFVIDGGISAAKRAAMVEELTALGGSVSFLEVDTSAYKDFPTTKHISAPAYYRISIPDLFADTVTRAIYLDCDVIVRGDLQELWGAELEGFPIAAVENVAGSTYKQSGLAQADYFNSGVMVIDLQIWREQNIPDKVRRFKLEHPELISTNDQCALNGVFRGGWARLPLQWNMQSGLYNDTQQVRGFKAAGNYEQSVWQPAIVHYVGWSKPWVQPCLHPLEGEYRRYLDMTRYAGTLAQTDKVPAATSWFKLFKKRWRQRRWQQKYRARGFPLYAQ